MVLVPVSVQYRWKCTFVVWWQSKLSQWQSYMDDGIWCHLSIGRSRWWGMRRQYPVNCKAICSDHPLLDHNWPGHQGDDIGVMVDSVMVDSVTMDSVMVDSVMVDGGRWWQEQTSALQQEISSRSSPPSHPTWKFVISTQLKLKLGRTRRVFRFWSRSRGRTTIGCLCSELAPCSTCQTKPIQNIFLKLNLPIQSNAKLTKFSFQNSTCPGRACACLSCEQISDSVAPLAPCIALLPGPGSIKIDMDRQFEKCIIRISHRTDLLVAVDAVAFVGAESIDASLRTDSNSFTLIHIWTLVDCSQILCLWLSFSQLCFLITLTLLSVVQLKARTTGAVIAFGGVHAQLKFMLSCLHQEIVL